MLELSLGILLARGSDLLRSLADSPAAPGIGERGRGGDEGEDPADDMSPQMVALRALKEIEFDRATGKLSDSDYEQLKAKYTEQALIALRVRVSNPGREPGDS